MNRIILFALFGMFGCSSEGLGPRDGNDDDTDENVVGEHPGHDDRADDIDNDGYGDDDTDTVRWIPQALTDGLSVQNAYDGLMTVSNDTESKDDGVDGVIDKLEAEMDYDGGTFLDVEGRLFLENTGAFHDNGGGLVYLVNARNDVECQLAYPGTFFLNGEKLWLDHGNSDVDSRMEIRLSYDANKNGQFDCADGDAPYLRIRLDNESASM